MILSLLVLLLAIVMTLPPLAEARSKKKDQGFPDYNRLEYAKPLPPPDEQKPEPKPGSIELRVGDQRRIGSEAVPLHAMPYAINTAGGSSDESEPPMDDLFNDPPPAASVPAVEKSTETPSN